MINKTNTLTVLFFSFVFFGCCGGLKPKTNFLNSNKIVENSLNSTVALVEVGENRNDFYCAGVYVNPTTILTARHCVVDIESYLAFKNFVGEEVFKEVFEKELYESITTTKIAIADYSDYKKHPSDRKKIRIKIAKIAYVSMQDSVPDGSADDNDIALLKIEQKDASRYWANIPKNNSKIGDKIFSIGMPIGQPWIFSEGIYAQHYYKRNKVTHIYANIYIAPGSSGGPLFNSSGELIGIASAYLTIPSEFSDNHSELGIFLHTDKLRQYFGLAEKFK